MGFFKTLMRKNTALLLSGQLVSTMGSVMQTTALSLFVIKLTGDALMFASVLAVAIIPRLFGPFTGVLADRQNRKRLLVILDVVAAFATLGFGLWHQFAGGLALPGVYALVLLLAAVQTFYDPTVGAIIPELVGHSELEEVNSASSFIINATSIVAPILAGVVYSHNSLFIIMVLNSLSFLSAAVLEACMSYKPAASLHEAAKEPVLKSFREGLVAVFGNRELTMIVVISIIANLALNPIFSVGLPYVMKQVLRVSDEMFGVSQSVLFVGPLIGSVVAGLALKKIDYKRMLTLILLLNGALVGLLALLTAFGIVSMGQFAAFVCINVTAMLIVSTIVLASIAISTAVQRITPVQLLGRVNGVDVSVSLMAIPLGQMLFGLGTRLAGAHITLLIFACAVVATGFVSYILYRPMLKAGSAPVTPIAGG